MEARCLKPVKPAWQSPAKPRGAKARTVKQETRDIQITCPYQLHQPTRIAGRPSSARAASISCRVTNTIEISTRNEKVGADSRRAQGVKERIPPRRNSRRVYVDYATAPGANRKIKNSHSAIVVEMTKRSKEIGSH